MIFFYKKVKNKFIFKIKYYIIKRMNLNQFKERTK